MTENMPASEVLSTNDCWMLLRSVSVGRLALWVVDHPDIFPINYALDHGTVVFRTGPGTKLSSVTGDTPIAFEADGTERDDQAWSVVIKGHMQPLHSIEELIDSTSLALFPWEAGHKDHFIRIIPSQLTGRRFTVTPPSTWWTPVSDTRRSALE